MSLTVTGSLRDIRLQCYIILDILRDREMIGWPPFQSDEIWMYRTAGDERVCPYCGSMDGQTFSGDQVFEKFPFHGYLDVDEVNTHTHQPRDDRCRCSLVWVNKLECLENRLHEEKVEAITVE
jgi:hypothetical protein